jgi:hypothetical protein
LGVAVGSLGHLVFVDCEARGRSPVNGVLTEFGAVHYETGQTFHGRLFEGTPDPANPAVPVVGPRIADDAAVAGELRDWLKSVCGRISPVMVSDNIAYDFMWIAGLFDRADMDNPFGHSGRRISDYYAGLTGRFGNTQAWKHLRVTPHDHNPVNDAMGNVEAFRRIQEGAR